jgi:PAS domain S-box-containing protein
VQEHLSSVLADQYRVSGVVDHIGAAGPSLHSWARGLSWRRLTRLLHRPVIAPTGAGASGGMAGSVLDVMGDWVCGLDAMGHITYANATLTRDCGCPSDALNGRPFLDLVPPGARDAIRLALHRATTTAEPQTCQHETLAAGGGSWRQWTFRPMPANREPWLSTASMLATGRDITEQKRLEHQFLHAQRLGSIGMLASGIAHDLNNVLAPIVMSIDLLRLRIGTEENRALLDVVATSAGRGASLVSQMLSFSRGLDDTREAVDLASLVRELGRFIGRTFAKNIAVHIEIAPDLRRLHANPTQIYQVLLNLCVNARDAMPQGGELTITAGNVTLDEAAARTLPGAAAGDYVMLGVSDTGTGIPPEIVNRIFDPFFTTKPIGEGTGLGLSTVRSIIKTCGGAITLSTQLGQGTTFHVYFPVVAAGAAEPVEQPSEENIRGAGEHVLVVDDEEFFRDVTRRLLEDFGYVVYMAADGVEAVKIFEQHVAEIAVAMVDLNMPIMDGRATIKALKAINPQVRIITVSGSDGAARPDDDVTDLRLTKPYSMGTLLHGLNQVLAESRPV